MPLAPLPSESHEIRLVDTGVGWPRTAFFSESLDAFRSRVARHANSSVGKDPEDPWDASTCSRISHSRSMLSFRWELAGCGLVFIFPHRGSGLSSMRGCYYPGTGGDASTYHSTKYQGILGEGVPRIVLYLPGCCPALGRLVGCQTWALWAFA